MTIETSVLNHCPEPMKFKDAGHFIQEYGGCIAEYRPATRWH